MNLEVLCILLESIVGSIVVRLWGFRPKEIRMWIFVLTHVEMLKKKKENAKTN